MDTPRVREEANDALESIADQIEEGIDKGKFSFRELQNGMMKKTKAAAQSTDQVVHENPWAAVGVAVGARSDARAQQVGRALPRAEGDSA